MTPEDLRDARMAEARRLTLAEGEENLNPLCVEAFANHLCDLIEQDWRPEPEVDAMTLAAREWGALCEPFYRENYRMGRMDDEVRVQAFRAGHAHALANHPDTRRMEWLDGQTVEASLTKPTGYFAHFGQGPGEPLRTKIDRAMEGGQ